MHLVAAMIKLDSIEYYRQTVTTKRVLSGNAAVSSALLPLPTLTIDHNLASSSKDNEWHELSDLEEGLELEERIGMDELSGIIEHSL